MFPGEVCRCGHPRDAHAVETASIVFADPNPTRIWHFCEVDFCRCKRYHPEIPVYEYSD